ncbi:MAG: hypothetical protein ACKOCD_07855 [Nitrospiraceae bacterium]
MFRAFGSPAAVSSLPAWNLLFAREPEPDLELDEPIADPDTADDVGGGGDAPQGSGDDKRQKMIKLALLAVVAGAGLYVAMDPSILRGPAEAPPPAPAPAPPKAVPAPAAAKPVAPPTPMAQAPAPQMTPAQPNPPMPAVASAPAPAMTPTPMTPPAMPKSAPTSGSSLSPQFSEGQQVVILADPAKPGGPVALMTDAGGSRTGPTIAPNSLAMVQDGELRNAGWVYAIRTAQGVTGWISEKQLQAKP